MKLSIANMMELEKHYTISLKFIDKLKLYLSNNSCLKILVPDKSWKRKNQFKKLYREGKSKINHFLDIVKITNQRKSIKILLENSIMDQEVKNRIKHNLKNLIDIDEYDVDSSLSSDGDGTGGKKRKNSDDPFGMSLSNSSEISK